MFVFFFFFPIVKIWCQVLVGNENSHLYCIPTNAVLKRLQIQQNVILRSNDIAYFYSSMLDKNKHVAALYVLQQCLS